MGWSMGVSGKITMIKFLKDVNGDIACHIDPSSFTAKLTAYLISGDSHSIWTGTLKDGEVVEVESTFNTEDFTFRHGTELTADMCMSVIRSRRGLGRVDVRFTLVENVREHLVAILKTTRPITKHFNYVVNTQFVTLKSRKSIIPPNIQVPDLIEFLKTPIGPENE